MTNLPFAKRPVDSLDSSEDLEISVELFAELIGEKDSMKVLHKFSREKMLISADLFMRLMKAPPKGQAPKMPWQYPLIAVGMLVGVALSPALPEKIRVGVILGILGGFSIGVFVGHFWKRIALKTATVMQNYWERQLKSLKEEES